ncbi:MAG: hypothetical protein ACI802_002090 [Candidatus Paceibacteria bacterium]|jgi:uncharacterized protein (DUF1501 family)
MTKLNAMNASRRAFLQRASALSVAGAATPWALNLAAMSEASAATATDYKAIVCIFLAGGNDYANTLVTYDTPSYNTYNKMRPTMAYARSSLSGTVLNPITAPIDSAKVSRQFALAPELAPLLPIFDAGKMGVVLNVGTLIQPTSKLQYTQKTVLLPPKLFSHNDQQSVWQSSSAEGASSGWGGRMGDLFQSANANSTFTCVNAAGNAVFLSGKSAVQYQVFTNGVVPFNGLKKPLFGSGNCTTALKTLMTQPRPHLMENEYVRVINRSISAGAVLTDALASAQVINTVFPAENKLGDQLKMVARMISAAGTVGAKRQVFFVSLGGFDTHDGLVTEHPGLLTLLADAMSAFYAATQELGVSAKVTTFTASDFGRTLAGNNNGSDHGWGSMHFVMGGAVNGKKFYGTPPIIADNGPDDVGRGRLIPTTSVDQYAATLGRWMGVSDTDLLALLPNLSNYDVSKRNLGFV